MEGKLRASANPALAAELDPTDAAEWADRTLAAAPDDDQLDEGDGGDDGEAAAFAAADGRDDEEGFAGLVAEVAGLLGSLAELRPAAYLAAAGAPLVALLPSFAAAGRGEGGGRGGLAPLLLFDLGTAAALLRAVLAHAPPAQAAELAARLAEALPSLPAAPPPPPSPLHWRAELSLLGLARLQCAALTADTQPGTPTRRRAAAAAAEGVEPLVAGLLGTVVPRTLRLVATAPGAAAGRAAGGLLLSLCAARWPAAAAPAFVPLRENAAAAAELVAPPRRPELLAAAGLAMLLPPRAAAAAASAPPPEACAAFAALVGGLAAGQEAAGPRASGPASWPPLARRLVDSKGAPMPSRLYDEARAPRHTARPRRAVGRVAAQRRRRGGRTAAAG